ncbi:MAG: ATP-binding protein [Pseudomonadota bacterium]
MQVGLRLIFRKLPKGLYGRSLIIIIAPMVLLQSVIAFVFMERHWQTVTQRLSRAVTADISAVIDIIENYPQDPDYEQITTLARDKLDLNISILPPDPFPPAVGKPFFSLLDDTLRIEITDQIARPFWIDTVGDSDILEIRIRLEEPDNVLRIFVRRNQAYASNSHIFLIWMVGTSLVLLAIAVLFLRNQIRPIQQLSNAVDSFGKGHDLPPGFRIRGALEVRQAGLAFMKMRERIERQIEQRTTMLNGVSHDLRTILTRFRLQLALFKQTDEIEELQADVDDMQKMLQGYLDYAKSQSDEQLSEVDVHEILSKYETEASLREKTLKIDCPVQAVFETHLNAFSRLIGNIVSNAFRYADTLHIKVDTESDHIDFTFDDDGPGIPEAHREDVFKPFFRMDEARNLDSSGTGLGLSIARDIARNHGGDITLQESPLGGLRVLITLPV